MRRPRFLIIPFLVGIGVLLLLQAQRFETVAQKQFLMGTFVEVKAIGEERAELERAINAAFEEIKRIEQKMSRAGEGELGRVNREAASQPVHISDELLFVLQEALKYKALTGGKFDVSIGKIVDAWGFKEDWDGVGRVPSREELEALLVPKEIIIDPLNKTVQLSSAAVEIDLGGIAKGYAVDKAIEVLRAYNIKGALVNAGGNIRVYGQRPESLLYFFERKRPFVIGIQHPRNEENILGAIELQGDMAVATSGDYQRYFFKDGIRYHHIFDPATGLPANETISATVIAPTALIADALSTGVFVLGPEKGMELIEQLENVEGIIVTPEGEILRSSGLRDAKLPSELP